MNVLVVEPGYAPYEKEINGLHEMQTIVGGPIQAIYPFQEQIAVVCNDEGLNLRLPFNRSVPGGYGGIFGTFFICGFGGENFCSLTPEQAEIYKKFFHQAEVLIGATGNLPITIPIPPMRKRTPTKQKKRGEHKGRE